MRPFRRTRQAVGQSLRLIETSCRVIEEAERVAARRPLRAGREYGRAAGCMGKATAQLVCAARALSVMTAKMALSPEHAIGSPRLLLDATGRWVAALGKLAILSNRLDDTYCLIVDAIEGGTPLDLSELIHYRTDAAQRVIRLRPLPARRLSCDTGSRIRVIHNGRRRSDRRTLAEVARRIFRGRAPPLVSTCSL